MYGMENFINPPVKRAENNVPIPIGPLNMKASIKRTRLTSAREIATLRPVNSFMTSIDRSMGFGAKSACKFTATPKPTNPTPSIKQET